jgi:hypothetical protein
MRSFGKPKSKPLDYEDLWAELQRQAPQIAKTLFAENHVSNYSPDQATADTLLLQKEQLEELKKSLETNSTGDRGESYRVVQKLQDNIDQLHLEAVRKMNERK